MNKFWIILFHTYLSKLKTKSFLITTAITLLVLVGMTNLQNIIEFFNREDQVKEVAVIDRSEEIYSLFAENARAVNGDIQLKLSRDNEDTLHEMVSNGELEGYLILDTNGNGIPKGTYKSSSMANVSVPQALEQALQQTKIQTGTQRLGLQQEQLAELLSPVSLERVALLENAKTEEELNQARGLVYILLFVIYFSVIMYSSMIAMEVATEKSSRVMEILISSVSPVKQMFAKILGIGLLSLTQLAVILVTGYLSMRSNLAEGAAAAGGMFNFTSIPTATFLYAGLFFLLGYFLFATLAAFLGSLVARIEDVQQMIGPMTFIIVAAFIIAMFGLGNPEAPFITATSYIPFFAPMIMFLRVGMLSVPFWEIALSVGLLLLTISVLAVFGARVYKGGVLMYGKSSSLKDLRKALQISKKDG
ncbi:ABC transporter permease [Bacillus lacus]|uniref:ABC transporter permease n=1 Tax=Metabacillus lacus TaxID=1983721 RepID=A0A7X2IYH9_9BACI|nr:ABC transporter permease [Metabacillus lacus]MRX71473.1 ABC transporter permease [Metabacillus lacus]